MEAGPSVDPACATPSTAATITLLFVSFWVLVVLARPFRPWKALLVAAMVALATLAFLLPGARDFFDFALAPGLVWQSLLIGAAGAFGVEVVYRLTYVRHHVPT